MRYASVISYFGEGFVGWQRQLNGLSVQEVLEDALSEALGGDICATASGRTDAGVHAEAQVVHFDAETSVPVEKIPFAVNAHLPEGVSMLSCEIAPDDFNARFSAKRKTYCYKIYVSRQPRPMLEKTHERISLPLDLKAMREAADIIEGTHDFACFEATGSKVKSTVRTVYGIEIEVNDLPSVGSVFAGKSVEDDGRDDLGENYITNCTIDISVTGNGFLYNMVRIIAGTLAYAGLHKLTPDDVKNILESGDRTLAGKTLSAKGLHLVKVVY